MSDKIKASLSCLSLVTYHLSSRWNISAGQTFELMLPVWVAVTVLLSAWVLASARRRGFGVVAVTLWTLGTLFFPLIILPLYLIACLYRVRREKASERPPLLLRKTLPLMYMSVMLGLCALYFYMDRRSPDAYHMRANQARVREQREQVIAEYRAALKLEDDAHTHNLLGKELQAAGRHDEALAEFRTAERMGEADEELSLNIAQSLDELKRFDEARPQYERFLNGPLCGEMPHDRLCAHARMRVAAMSEVETQ